MGGRFGGKEVKPGVFCYFDDFTDGAGMVGLDVGLNLCLEILP
jgi:hypothetical protein